MKSKKTILAFHGDPNIKEKYLARVRAHRAADQITKGQYWKNGKGCAVGCTVHSSDHSAYETELGIPQMLARLEDGIFENLPNALSMEWPERFLSCIHVGADLSNVRDHFLAWLLADPSDGVIRFAENDTQREAISRVAGEVSESQWAAAWAAAWAAHYVRMADKLIELMGNVQPQSK